MNSNTRDGNKMEVLYLVLGALGACVVYYMIRELIENKQTVTKIEETAVATAKKDIATAANTVTTDVKKIV